MNRWKSAIIGLGQVGMGFDKDPLRQGVWTHFKAYETLNEFCDLIAVSDPLLQRREEAMARKSGVRAYDSLEKLLENETVDLLSLCTPPELHLSQIEQAIGKVKVIICEKPLGGSVAAAQEVLQKAQKMQTVILVNYYKRFDGAVPDLMKALSEIGGLTSLTGYYSGPLEAVGSHMIDLIQYILGPIKVKSFTKMPLEGISFSFESKTNLNGYVAHTGKREDLLFELDIIGSNGRLRLLENCNDLEWMSFQPSSRYSGYRQLTLNVSAPSASKERFIPLFEEAIEYLNGARSTFTSDGSTALDTQRVMESFL